MLRFSRPKGPGFGISRAFYLSVLSTKPTLPALQEWITPKGDGNTVAGFGAPLNGGNDKELLTQPMTRGAYALATPDRKTLLRMFVLSKEEAGFDPEVFARSSIGEATPLETLSRIRGTWTLAQLTFESHDPAVYPALDFILNIAQKFGELTEGAIADPVSRRYLLPHELTVAVRADAKVDAREHVSVNFRNRTDGDHAFTLGMQKFDLPELEITGLMPSDTRSAARFLLGICQSALLGNAVESGSRFGAAKATFEAQIGGFDRAHWRDVPVLEMLPPTGLTSSEALAEWDQELGLA